MDMSCFHCKNEIPVPEVSGRVSVAFRESCPKCGTDLHICLNCNHYDQGSHHECRESSAEWIRNKEKAKLQELSERRSRGARRAIQKIRSPIPFYKMSGIRAVRLR